MMGNKRESTLTLIVGAQNSGKTEYSQRFEGVIHLDDMKGKWPTPLMAVNAAAAAEESPIVEGCFWKAEYRKGLINACAGKARKVCIFIDTPVEECVEREKRYRPEGMIRMIARMFQTPTLEEGWDRIERMVDGEVVEVIE